MISLIFHDSSEGEQRGRYDLPKWMEKIPSNKQGDRGVCWLFFLTNSDWDDGVISQFLYPDLEDNHFHGVFTGLRLGSLIAPMLREWNCYGLKMGW